MKVGKGVGVGGGVGGAGMFLYFLGNCVFFFSCRFCTLYISFVLFVACFVCFVCFVLWSSAYLYFKVIFYEYVLV